MVLKNIFTKVAPAVRNIHTSAVARAGHGNTRGVFGSNVPFPVNNRPLLTAIFIVFFGSGLALPFIVVRAQILSKNQD